MYSRNYTYLMLVAILPLVPAFQLVPWTSRMTNQQQAPSRQIWNIHCYNTLKKYEYSQYSTISSNIKACPTRAFALPLPISRGKLILLLDVSLARVSYIPEAPIPTSQRFSLELLKSCLCCIHLLTVPECSNTRLDRTCLPPKGPLRRPRRVTIRLYHRDAT